MRRKTETKKQTPGSRRYRKRLAWRIFFSLLLILAALYIREREPVMADFVRQQLHVSMDFSRLTAFLSPP